MPVLRPGIKSKVIQEILSIEKILVQIYSKLYYWLVGKKIKFVFVENSQYIYIYIVATNILLNFYRLQQFEGESQVKRKTLYLSLYLLIWGEAANLRFMPECLCYLFRNVRMT